MAWCLVKHMDNFTDRLCNRDINIAKRHVSYVI